MMRKKKETEQEEMSRVYNFNNESLCKKEKVKVFKATKFYSEEIKKVIQRHKTEWTHHGRSELFEKTRKPGSSFDSFYAEQKRTPLEMLSYQIDSKYTKSPSFSSLAYQNTYVPFYIPKENKSIQSLKKGTKDQRPEQLIVVRSCPSRYLVEQFIPEEMRTIKPKQNSYEFGYTNDHKSGSSFQYISEEEKNLTLLKDMGLDKRIKVAFVFVVPYNPTVKWKNNQPPPEQALHFCSYFKFALSCFTRAKLVVTMNAWCTKMMVSQGNADQLAYAQEIPAFGEKLDGINIYPLTI